MKIKAALYNADHLEYGLVTIPFPISRDQYDDTIKMLEALDIGDPRARDCTVEEIEGSAPSLKCLEGRRINVDELDYMVKRLDSFSDGELAQFQGMAVKMGLSDMTDLINLTFCCQQATVITDFSDLEQIGREHYMNLHGGCASMEELEQLDGVETALLLISENEGTVDTAGVCLDAFISQVREAYDRLELFGPEQCEPNSFEKLNYEGKVLVLAPDTLKESYWNARAQLWLAHDGFGCRPNAIGRSIRCTCLGDGEMTRWNRTDFIGVLKEEFLPDWAKEKLMELKGQEQRDVSPMMGGMTME